MGIKKYQSNFEKVVYSGPVQPNPPIRWATNRIKRKNNSTNIRLVGDTGCLSGDTKLYNNQKSIGELYDSGNINVDTYSINKGKKRLGCGCFYPVKSKSEIIFSGNKELYEIELENGKKVYATSEHRFFSFNSNKRVEKVVSELKIGDKLVCYPEDYINNYISKANKSAMKTRIKQFKNKKICNKCKNLFFVNFGNNESSHKFCINCRNNIESIISPIRHWYEWEDNLIRQFYYDMSKDKLMELLPLRKSWSAIMHRADRLNVKRSIELKLQSGKNYFTSKINPMHNEICRKKAKEKLKNFYKENPERLTNFQLRRNHITKIEQKVKDFLDSKGVNYEYNQVVRTKTTFRFPDFKIGNLIIECDGNYWHKNNKDKDNSRQKELEDLGFEVIRFNDKDILKNFEEVKQCIVQKLNQ